MFHFYNVCFGMISCDCNTAFSIHLLICLYKLVVLKNVLHKCIGSPAKPPTSLCRHISRWMEKADIYIYIYIYIFIYIYICIYVHIYININCLWLDIKLSINNSFKKTFFKNQLYFALFKNLKIVYEREFSQWLLKMIEQWNYYINQLNKEVWMLTTRIVIVVFTLSADCVQQR